MLPRGTAQIPGHVTDPCYEGTWLDCGQVLLETAQRNPKPASK